MWELSEVRNIHLSAVYLPGHLDLIADTLSLLINLDSEWMLNPSIFRQVCPKVDLFATRVNNQVPNFLSQYPDPEAMTTNAFTVSWSGHLNYAYPLFSPIMKCLKKIQTDKAIVLLWLQCGDRDHGSRSFFQCHMIAHYCSKCFKSVDTTILPKEAPKNK